jgi:hypothetical protein
VRKPLIAGSYKGQGGAGGGGGGRYEGAQIMYG